jgi:hypothetical protein
MVSKSESISESLPNFIKFCNKLFVFCTFFFISSTSLSLLFTSSILEMKSFGKIIDVVDLNKENYLIMNGYDDEDGQSRSASVKRTGTFRVEKPLDQSTTPTNSTSSTSSESVSSQEAARFCHFYQFYVLPWVERVEWPLVAAVAYLCFSLDG